MSQTQVEISRSKPLTLQIESVASESKSKRQRRQPAKTRSFTADLVAAIAWNECAASYSSSLTNTKGGAYWPLYFAISGTDQSVRSFVANLRTRRAAMPVNERLYSGSRDALRIELPRTLKYQFRIRQAGGTSFAEAYVPAIFHYAQEVEPAEFDEKSSEAMADGGRLKGKAKVQIGEERQSRFCIAVPKWWVDREAPKLARPDFDGRRAAVACYVTGRLNHRVSLPILNNLDFQASMVDALVQKTVLDQQTRDLDVSDFDPYRQPSFYYDSLGTLFECVFFVRSWADVERVIVEETQNWVVANKVRQTRNQARTEVNHGSF